MAPQTFTRLAARDDSSNDSTNSPTIIAGIIVAAVIGLGAAIWLVFRWYRKRAVQKREERRGSAFDHFQADDGMSEKSGLPRCVASFYHIFVISVTRRRCSVVWFTPHGRLPRRENKPTRYWDRAKLTQ